MNSSVLSGAASASYRARASLSYTPVSAVAWMTSAGRMIRARCGAAVHCEVRRLHIDSQLRSVLTVPTPNTP